MSGSLDGKVTIVTGGGRGIGLGITRCLVEAGASVVVAQRNPPPGDLDADRVAFVAADLSQAADAARVVAETERRFGGCDVLVNNAGIMFEKRVEDTSESDWDAMLTVNLKAPFLLIKHALPAMRRRGGGSIVNIGSIEGLGSNPGHAAYSASKAGLHGLTGAVAVDHGRDNIRCNAIAPGWIDSDLSETYIESFPDSERFRRDLLAMHPAGRLGTPRDVGNMAVWLASDASAFVTGQVFVVDGGRTRKLPLPVAGA